MDRLVGALERFDTPVTAIAESSEILRPDAIVVAALEGRRLRAIADELASLAEEHPLYLAGARASAHLAKRLGGELLEGEPVHAAKVLDEATASAVAA